MHFDWLKGLISRNSTRGNSQAARKRKPPRQQMMAAASVVEPLEERVVPAIYTVTGTEDGAGTVTPNGVDFNATTLRGAINAANATPEFDTINLPSGTITLDGAELSIEFNSLEIIGAGTNETTIDANHASRIFAIGGEGPNETNVTLKDLTIENGFTSYYGGAIEVYDTTLTLVNARVQGSTSYGGLGGAIYASGSDLSLENSTVTNSKAVSVNPSKLAGGGGIATRLGTLSITSSTISNNQAIGAAGVTGYSGMTGAQGAFGTTGANGGTGGTGGTGQTGGAGQGGGGAQGGGIYTDTTETTIAESTISNNSAIGGAGGLGGTGGMGGVGGTGGTGTEGAGGSGGNGGTGGAGGAGGAGGLAQGGGVFIYDSAITITLSNIAENTAVAGAAGAGGIGGIGGTGGSGAIGTEGPGNGGNGGTSGSGGAGGLGGAAVGGGISTEDSLLTINNSTTTANSVVGGAGGAGGTGGAGGFGGVGFVGNAMGGSGGAGGNGGLPGFAGLGGTASGGGIAAKNLTVSILNSTIDTNSATGGASGGGGNGGAGGAGGDGAPGVIGGAGGAGGAGGPYGLGGIGGTSQGGGYYSDNAATTITNSTFAYNTATGGVGSLSGFGGAGGAGGAGGSGDLAGPGGAGGDGGAGGAGGGTGGQGGAGGAGGTDGGPGGVGGNGGDGGFGSPAGGDGGAGGSGGDGGGDIGIGGNGGNGGAGGSGEVAGIGGSGGAGGSGIEQGATGNTGAWGTIGGSIDNGVGGSATGGAIAINSDPLVSISNSTIAYNSVYGGMGSPNGTATGGGITGTGTGVTLFSSILAANTAGGAGNDLQGSFHSYGYNFIQYPDSPSATITGDVLSDLTGVSPGFDGGLLDNGGPTRTIALLSDSPLVDASASADPTLLYDQRGLKRIFGDNLDIGAFEFQIPNSEPTLETPLLDQNATEDSPFTFTVPAGTFVDTDPLDTLTYSATGLPSWLTFDPETRTFNGTPLNGDVNTVGVTITVRATDPAEAYAEDTFVLKVANTNDYPTVDQGISNKTATEDSLNDVDLGDNLTYSVQGLPAWLSFDPGTGKFHGTPTNSDVTVVPVTITVIATDESEQWASTTFDLTVLNTNDAPFVDEGISHQTAYEDSLFSFTIPNDAFGEIDLGDSLTYVAENMPDWLFFNPRTHKFQGTPTNDDVTTDGPILITVRVTDGSGLSACTQFCLTVENTNDAPFVDEGLSNQTATEDQAFSFVIPKQAFGDIDYEDSLTFSVSNLPCWLSFDPETLEFTGTPTNKDVTRQPICITVTASDEAESSVSTKFELTVLNTNDAPYVRNEFSDQTAEEDELFTYEIPCDIFKDVDRGDSLTYSATGLPAWLTFDPETRTFSGTPAQSDITTDPIEIVVTVEDESHETAWTTLKLNVINTNDAPELVNPLSPQTATEDTPFSFTVPSDTFTDIDPDDTLSYYVLNNPAWLQFDPVLLKFSGTPANGDVTTDGPITITLVARDGAQDTATATFTLTVLNTNDLPTVDNPIAPLTATEDVAFEFTIPENTFGDVDVGDTLAYYVAGLPGWLSFDAETLTFSGTPGNEDVGGPVQFSITVTDDDGNTATNIVDLTVLNANDAPTVVNAPGNQQATEDTLFTFTLPMGVFADIDVNDSLTYSVTGLPEWLSFDPDAGVFSGTPANGDVTSSPITITVIATDESDATATTTFELTVLNTNDAPTVAHVITAQTATEDSEFSFTLPGDTFADVDVGDSLNYSVSGLPGWLSFDPETGVFSGTPANGDVTVSPITITVIATDESEATVSTTFQLTVLNTNDAPTVANQIGPKSAMEDVTFNFTMPPNTFSDSDVGDTLTYSATGLPSWLSFDPETRVFSGTPLDTDTGSGPSTITVTANDGHGGTVSTTFELSVTAINDHTPEFNTGTQTVSLLEKSADDTIVATVSATDADLPGESLQYSIIGGNTSGAFFIDPVTGVITVANSAALNFGTTPSFELEVQVTDNGSPTVKTATAIVTVNLTQLPGPTITLNPNAGLFYIDDVRSPVDPTATFTNQRTVETFEGAQLKVSIASGRVRRDALRILAGNKISTRGDRVYFKDVEIGTVAGGNDRDPDLVVTFNSSASTAAINALVKQINFSATRGVGETRQVTMQVLNLSGTDSAIASRNINVQRLARGR